MLSKSLMQFSVGKLLWICVSSLFFHLRPNYLGGNKDMVFFFKRFHAGTAILSVPDPAAGHCRPTPLLETPGHSQASQGQSLLGSHCSFLLEPGVHKVLFVPSKSVSPVLCKFWWLYDGVNGDLPQEGLMP